MSAGGKPPLETVLLLALPASGKSEVRTYLDHVDDATRLRDFRMNPSVQLDDFPYVHFMRVIDDTLAAQGEARRYFPDGNSPFIDPRDWGTLVHLLNEDYDDLVARRVTTPASPGEHLLDRMSAAARKVRAPTGFAGDWTDLAKALDKEAGDFLKSKHANYPDTLSGKTLVIEFARGGPAGAKMPLPDPIGYRYAFSQLSDAILEKASVLYIWVEPEESKRKNLARMKPGEDGSILHHGVPEKVMEIDYGCDDIAHLVETSEKPGTITVSARGKKYFLPVGRVDNRVDKTSFLRDDSKTWKKSDLDAVHAAIRDAVAGMA